MYRYKYLFGNNCFMKNFYRRNWMPERIPRSMHHRRPSRDGNVTSWGPFHSVPHSQVIEVSVLGRVRSVVSDTSSQIRRRCNIGKALRGTTTKWAVRNWLSDPGGRRMWYHIASKMIKMTCSEHFSHRSYSTRSASKEPKIIAFLWSLKE